MLVLEDGLVFGDVHGAVALSGDDGFVTLLDGLLPLLFRLGVVFRHALLGLLVFTLVCEAGRGSRCGCCGGAGLECGRGGSGPRCLGGGSGVASAPARVPGGAMSGRLRGGRRRGGGLLRLRCGKRSQGEQGCESQSECQFGEGVHRESFCPWDAFECVE